VKGINRGYEPLMKRQKADFHSCLILSNSAPLNVLPPNVIFELTVVPERTFLLTYYMV